MTEFVPDRPADAEQARERAEALTQAVIESALDCIVTIDHEGRVVEFNPAAERTFGYRRADALNQLLGDLIVPPAFRAAHFEGLRRYLATGVGPVLGKRIEISAMRADGSEFPVELAIAVVQQGATPLFTAYLRDISERKRHELWAAVDHGVTLAIADGKTRREAVSAILRTLCKSLDWDVGCLFVLEPIERSLRCFKVWTGGDPALELFAAATKRETYRPDVRAGEEAWRKREPAWHHPLDDSLGESRAQAAREAGLCTGFSFPLFVDQEFRGLLELYSRRPRQPELDLLERFEILGDRIAQYIERKQAEDRLRTSEEELADFFENGPIGLHWVDAFGVIVRANRTELEWLGYSREEYVGQRIEDFHVDPAALREFLGQVRAGRTVCDFEAQLRCKDGSIRHVMLNANAYERDGVFVHTRCFTRDITERRKAQAEARAGQQLLDSIRDAQARYIIGGDSHSVFDKLLHDLLRLTGSAYGFIGELRSLSDGRKYLQTHAITNLAWDDDSRAFYERAAPDGLAFFNLDSLFGEVLKTGRAVVANSPASDPRAAGVPHGHPPLDAFLGMPFMRGDELLGMVGIANRADGYDEGMIEYLQPFLGTCAALVEANRSQELRRAAEAERDRFFSVSVDLLCIGGFDGYLKRINPAWMSTLGWTEEELLARPYVDFVHPEDRQLTESEILALQQPGYRTQNFRNRNLCKNGAYRWFYWSATSTPEHQLIYASARDITEQRRIELALMDRETRIRSIVDFAVDSIVVIDERGVVESFNPAAERMFGYREDEIRGRNVALLMEDAEASLHDGYLLNYLKTGAAKVIGVGREAIGRRRDGSVFPLELTVSEMRLGEQRKFTGILRDITARKKAEQDLQLALQEAEAANRAKSQFLANISHEVRTPMAAILGYADMLRQADLRNDDRERLLGALRRNGEHLLQIINDVLDVSKIEFGGIETEIAATPLWPLVMEAVEAARVRAAERRLELEVVPIGRLPASISTDALRLRQILDNLLSNAVKFTDAGAIQVRVRCDQRKSGSSSIVLEVEDQGIGMSEEQVSRLFRPFSQVDTSYSRKYSGTGLGLSICKRLAEAMGGTIAVRSVPGEGSCFTVRLPVAPADLTSWAEPEDASGAAGRADPSRGSAAIRGLNEGAQAGRPRGRLLLAEDSPDNRTILTFFLERAGYVVEHAVNGREALQKALQGNVDLVLMDMQMPEMDGYEATRELRKSGFTKPIIALTAHAMRGHDQTCIAQGCSAYLSKPVDPETLNATVGAELARDAANRTAPSAEATPSAPSAANGAADAPVDELAGLRAAYVASLPGRVADLRDAFQRGNWGRLGELAHQMKGSAPMYGFVELGKLMALVDQTCREGLPAELLAELLEQVEEQCRGPS